MQPPPTPLARPAVIGGRYQTEAVLGQGGFGVVYAALDLTMGRPVALKVLRPELFDQNDAMQRFRREAELAMRLEHPHTVRLYDVGVASDGLAYIAFERLTGRTLSETIEAERALAPERVARIASSVLSSLMEAHARGIIHRDIKPSNVFLCDFVGAPDFVKVLDFGIAKAAAQEGQSRAGLTATGEVLGTPRYMAPEQALGQPLTPATDLYALGLMMSEALSGEPIYKGQALTVCMEQASPAPVPHRPEVMVSALGPVILRATQKQASARYASAEEMLRHLEAVMSQAGAAWLRAPPLPAAPPSSAGMRASGVGSAMMQAPLAVATTATGGQAFTPPPAVFSPPQATFMTFPPVPPQAPAARSRGPLLVLVGLLATAVIAGVVALVILRSGGLPDTTAAASSGAAASPTGAAASPTGAGVAANAAAAGGRRAPAPRPSAPAAPSSTADAPAAGAPFSIMQAVMGMDAAAAAAKGCSHPGLSGMGSVVVVFASDGHATSVFVGAPYHGTPGGACMEAAFRGVRVNPFNNGVPMSASKSYMF